MGFTAARVTKERSPGHRHRTRRLAVVSLAVACLFGSLVPAQAAVTTCSVSALRPVKGKNGTTVVADSRMDCNGTNAWARQLCTQIQEEFGFVWYNRGAGCRLNSPGVKTLSNAWNVSCAGHGQDNWRNRTDATDSAYATRVRFSAASTITC